ncbi:MAG: alpha/beta fold hydrolase, partial [Kineosporiaceae bacterium]
TLVLHRQGERQIPAEVSRRLAEALPDADLVQLPGSTPTLFVEDVDGDVALVTEFVTSGLIPGAPRLTVLRHVSWSIS